MYEVYFQGKRDYRFNVCLRNVFTYFSPRISSLLTTQSARSGHPRAEPNSAGMDPQWYEGGRRTGTGGVGRWKYHLSRPGLSISTALIR